MSLTCPWLNRVCSVFQLTTCSHIFYLHSNKMKRVTMSHCCDALKCSPLNNLVNCFLIQLHARIQHEWFPPKFSAKSCALLQALQKIKVIELLTISQYSCFPNCHHISPSEWATILDFQYSKGSLIHSSKHFNIPNLK